VANASFLASLHPEAHGELLLPSTHPRVFTRPMHDPLPTRERGARTCSLTHVAACDTPGALQARMLRACASAARRHARKAHGAAVIASRCSDRVAQAVSRAPAPHVLQARTIFGALSNVGKKDVATTEEPKVPMVPIDFDVAARVEGGESQASRRAESLPPLPSP
jgi:hypothetical protein